MSKVSDKLRAAGYYNNHGLLLAFGSKNDVCVYFRPGERRSVRCSRSVVYSPRFKTDHFAHWQDDGCKVFLGKRAESMPAALAWASKRYGIKEWVTSPTDRSAKLPAHVVAKAREAVK